ncbi:MAG: hypothetical protein PW792_05925 [Acidobacteriaceae bacterium]|nr:hypothetical protein [Acidobacteriaceae bacterium]
MEELWVRLGEKRYRVERPFGDVPGVEQGSVSDVAVNSRGHIFVLLRRDPLLTPQAAAVVELALDGSRVRAWGEEIADAHMLVCHPANDDVFVVDRDAHEVRRYSAEGQYKSSLGTRHRPGEPFSHPTDIAFMPGGEMVVADGYGNATVHIFAPDGERLRSFGKLGTQPGKFLTPHSVCPLDQQHVVVVDRENHRLQVFSLEGKLVDVWGGFFRPQSVWSDGRQLFVTDAVPSLSLLSLTGERISRCRPVLNGAHGLAGDPASGCLYLAETSPSRLTCLVPEDKEASHVV